CCSDLDTVFKLTTGGKITVLHRFNGTDGSAPKGGVVQGSDGNLYGTASGGGKYNGGVAFKLTLGGVLTILKSFNPQSLDGYEPWTLILATDGKFHGTTRFGGHV